MEGVKLATIECIALKWHITFNLFCSKLVLLAYFSLWLSFSQQNTVYNAKFYKQWKLQTPTLPFETQFSLFQKFKAFVSAPVSLLFFLLSILSYQGDNIQIGINYIHLTSDPWMIHVIPSSPSLPHDTNTMNRSGPVLFCSILIQDWCWHVQCS